MKQKLKRYQTVVGAVVVTLIYSLTTYYAINSIPMPGVAESNHPAEKFSARRAFEHIKKIAREPRPNSSPALRRVQRYLMGELKKMNLKPRLRRNFVIRNSFESVYSGARVANILARLPGENSGGEIVMMAHYDSVPTSPGAGDNATGVAVILETVRALKIITPRRHDIIILFTDAEEIGMLGVNAILRENRISPDALVLNFDARGNRGPAIMFEPGIKSGLLINELLKNDLTIATSLSAEIYQFMPNETDFTFLKQRGQRGLNFAFIENIAAYHGESDTPENLSLQTVQHLGEQALAITEQLANLEDLNGDISNPVYFFYPGLGMISYSTAFSALLVVITFILYLGLFWTALANRNISLRGLATGFFFPLVALLILVPIILLVVLLLLNHHSDLSGQVTGGFPSDVYFKAAFHFFTLLVLAFLYNFARRYFNLAELYGGGLLLGLMVMMGCAALLPGAAYYWQWPLLFVLPGFYLLARRSDKPEQVIKKFRIVFLVASLLTLLSAALTLTLLYEALTLRLSAVYAVFLVLSLLPLLPLLEELRRLSYRDLLPGLGVLSLLLFAIGLIASRSTPEQPRGSSIVFFQDEKSRRADWVSCSRYNDSWLEQFLGSEPQKGDLSQHLPLFRSCVWNFSPFLQSPATYNSRLKGPRVQVLSRQRKGGVVDLSVSITSRPESDLLALMIERQHLISVKGGVTIIENKPADEKPNKWIYNIISRYLNPDEWVALFISNPYRELNLVFRFRAAKPGESAFRFRVYNQFHGLPQLPGKKYQPRNASQTPAPTYPFIDSSFIGRGYEFR